MLEIIVGLIVLVFFYRVFPKKSESDRESLILPFLDEDARTNGSKPKNEYYDWGDEDGDDFTSNGEDSIGEADADLFDEESFHHD